MHISNGFLSLVGILLIGFLLVWYLRAKYYETPKNRMKWHKLHINQTSSLGPDHIQAQTSFASTDSAKWFTVELQDNILTVKLPSDEVALKLKCSDIPRIISPFPGVVKLTLTGEKFLSLKYNVVMLDFRLSVMSWYLFNFRSVPHFGNPTLPPKWLAAIIPSMVESDKKALRYYVAISDAKNKYTKLPLST